MLWRDASVPVAKVDHATGEIDGQAVASGAKLPSAASLARFGRRPASMYSLALRGSKPSSPTTTTRLTLALPRRGAVTMRMAALNGHTRMMAKASRKVPSSTSTEPAAAKPAPGPM
jgi:hypothetical protein